MVVSRPGCPAASLADALPAVRPRLRVVANDTDPHAEGTLRTPVVFLIDGDTPDVSSSDIRTRLANGCPLEERVPAAVAAYIDRRRLYVRDPLARELHD